MIARSVIFKDYLPLTVPLLVATFITNLRIVPGIREPLNTVVQGPHTKLQS
jgi:hypothetical protein